MPYHGKGTIWYNTCLKWDCENNIQFGKVVFLVLVSKSEAYAYTLLRVALNRLNKSHQEAG